jgi:hypothetical protein
MTLAAAGPKRLTPAAREALEASVAREVSGWCQAVSPQPMPPIAQKLHGRTFYVCGLDKGHLEDGIPHRWPRDPSTPPIVVWR